jgi:hypothetical protein
LSHVTCSYIRMYINAVTDSVMLWVYLQHDFYNITFKNQTYIFYSLMVAPPPPPLKNSGFAQVLAYGSKKHRYSSPILQPVQQYAFLHICEENHCSALLLSLLPLTAHPICCCSIKAINIWEVAVCYEHKRSSGVGSFCFMVIHSSSLTCFT